MPNVMVALYSTPQSLADAHYYMPCSNAAKTQNQLKFGGVPQTNETISAEVHHIVATSGGHIAA